MSLLNQLKRSKKVKSRKATKTGEEYWNPKLLRASRNPQKSKFAWAVFSALRGPDQDTGFRRRSISTAIDEAKHEHITGMYLKSLFTARIRAWAMTSRARAYYRHAIVGKPYTKEDIFVALDDLTRYYLGNEKSLWTSQGHFIEHLESALRGIIAIERWKRPTEEKPEEKKA